MEQPNVGLIKGCQLLVGLIALFSSALASAHTCNKVTAAAHPNYPPYHWLQNGKLVGASVDITRNIFRELGVEFEPVYAGPWKRVLESARASKFDMVLGLKRTPERSSYLQFSQQPILPNPFAVFVNKQSAIEFVEWQDLIGLKGVKNPGDRYGEEFDYFSAAKLNLVEGYSIVGNFQKLISGRADYFIHSKHAGEAFIGANSLQHEVMAMPTLINEGFLHSGFTSQSPCVAFNGYLSQRYEAMLSSGEALQILQLNRQKWLEYQQKQGQ